MDLLRVQKLIRVRIVICYWSISYTIRINFSIIKKLHLVYVQQTLAVVVVFVAWSILTNAFEVECFDRLETFILLSAVVVAVTKSCRQRKQCYLYSCEKVELSSVSTNFDRIWIFIPWFDSGYFYLHLVGIKTQKNGNIFSAMASWTFFSGLGVSSEVLSFMLFSFNSVLYKSLTNEFESIMRTQLERNILLSIVFLSNDQLITCFTLHNSMRWGFFPSTTNTLSHFWFHR